MVGKKCFDLKKYWKVVIIYAIILSISLYTNSDNVLSGIGWGITSMIVFTAGWYMFGFKEGTFSGIFISLFSVSDASISFTTLFLIGSLLFFIIAKKENLNVDKKERFARSKKYLPIAGIFTGMSLVSAPIGIIAFLSIMILEVLLPNPVRKAIYDFAYEEYRKLEIYRNIALLSLPFLLVFVIMSAFHWFMETNYLTTLTDMILTGDGTSLLTLYNTVVGIAPVWLIVIFLPGLVLLAKNANIMGFMLSIWTGVIIISLLAFGGPEAIPLLLPFFSLVIGLTLGKAASLVTRTFK